jgi:hypothetical protein
MEEDGTRNQQNCASGDADVGISEKSFFFLQTKRFSTISTIKPSNASKPPAEPIVVASTSNAPVAIPTPTKSIDVTLPEESARVARQSKRSAGLNLKKGAAGEGRPRPSIEPVAPLRSHRSCDCFDSSRGLGG